jgi:competence protein ComEA
MNFFRSTRAFVATVSMLGLVATSLSGQTEAPQPVKPAGDSGKIDLNTADSRTLETLPGVTPVIAKAIIAARPFRSIDDLQKVDGIGTEHLEQLKTVATVSLPAKYVARILPPGKSAPKAARPKVDLNTASRERLAAIAGATPEVVEAIMAARPFSSLDDLDRVKGLTAEQLEQLRAALTVSPTPAARPPR